MNLPPEKSLQPSPGKDINISLNTAKYERNHSPAFPIALLPPTIAKIVYDLETNAGYNRDFMAASMLYAAAVAMGYLLGANNAGMERSGYSLFGFGSGARNRQITPPFFRG
jgi:hypothetical protein